MKLIYVAGPISAVTAWEREQNIRKAESVALDIAKLGAAVHCPHTQCRYYDNEMPWVEWIKRDIEVLKRCDAVFLLPGWSDSSGATAENRTANENNLPTFTSLDALKHWLDEEEAS